MHHFHVAHIGIVKGSALAAAIVAGVATAIVDPSIKVAMITGISIVAAAFVAAVVQMVIAIMNYKLQNMSYKLQQEMHVVQAETKDAVGEVKKQTDGMFTKMSEKMDNLTNAKEQQTIKLADKSEQLAHAEGRREGSESERDLSASQEEKRS